MIKGNDISVISEYLKAAANGPFFPEWEFQTLFGLEREEVRAISNRLPDDGIYSEDAIIAICNTFANLLYGYPCGFLEGWQKWVKTSPQEAEHVFERWRAINAPA